MTDKHDLIASEPDLSRGAVYPGSVGIDFASATKLETTGTTCDAYRVRKDNTLLFVKKLKERWAFNPIYRDALHKEFSIGQSLEHDCLPVYHYAIDDYIVMNYIDGDTLARLISNDDNWLHSDNNIISILTKLTDVIGYLHKKGVVHCDVKTDNVMITHNNRNIKLIDLDKCYTDSRVFSPGLPKLYGAEKAGSPDNDFNGLAIIAESLSKFASKSLRRRINKFIESCHKKDANTDELLTTLSLPKKKLTLLLFGLAVIVLIALVAIVYFLSIHSEGTQTLIQPEATEIESVSDEMTEESEQLEDKSAQSQENTTQEREINNQLTNIYQPLYDKIAEVERTDFEELSQKGLYEIVTELSNIQQEVWDAGFSKFREYHPEMEYSAAYEMYIKQSAFQQMTSRLIDINERLAPYIERFN